VPAVASGLWVGGSVERKSHRLWDRAVGAAVHLDQEDPRSFTIRKPDGCEPQSEAVVDLAHDQLDMRAAVGNGHQPTDLGGGSGHHEVRKVVGAPTPLVDPLPRIQSGAPEAHANRKTLTAALTNAGLVNYPTEWWHWSYGDRYWAFVTGAPHALYGPTKCARTD